MSCASSCANTEQRSLSCALVDLLSCAAVFRLRDEALYSHVAVRLPVRARSLPCAPLRPRVRCGLRYRLHRLLIHVLDLVQYTNTP